MNQSSIDLLRKRLYYLSSHRGTKEADLIFGGYAEVALPKMNPSDLETFYKFLSFPDAPLMAWVMGSEKAPAEFEKTIVPQLRKFTEDKKTV